MKKDFYASARWTISIGFLKGFSLIELLTSLALLSVLLAVALPSFSSIISRVQIDADVSAIRGALSFTRMTAISKHQQVIACRWNGVDGCTGNAGSGTLSWEKGIFVYIDIDGNKTWDSLIDAPLKVVAFSLNNAITWNRGEKVVFKSDGSSPGYNGTFVLSGMDSSSARLVLSMTGRLRNDSTY